MMPNVGEYAVAFWNEISSRTVEDLRYCFLYRSKALSTLFTPFFDFGPLKVILPIQSREGQQSRQS